MPSPRPEYWQSCVIFFPIQLVGAAALLRNAGHENVIVVGNGSLCNLLPEYARSEKARLFEQNSKRTIFVRNRLLPSRFFGVDCISWCSKEIFSLEEWRSNSSFSTRFSTSAGSSAWMHEHLCYGAAETSRDYGAYGGQLPFCLWRVVRMVPVRSPHGVE